MQNEAITHPDSESVEEFNKLMLLLGGHIFFQTLSAAVELDLFGLLKKSGPMSRKDISRHLGIDEKPTRILLLGCATLELVHLEENLYRNSDLANKFLDRDEPGNVVAVIEWQHHINYRPMFWFYDALKQNKNVGLKELEGTESTLYERLTHNPRLENIFQAAMESISVQANAAFAQSIDLSSVKHLVDIGGGNGMNAMTLARRFPGLRATVFDSPSVCEIANKCIAESGISERVDTFPGDCFETPFPTDADCLLFCHFLTIWSEEENVKLLKKAYDALLPGGKAIVFNMMQDDSETGPLSAALGSPYFLTLATGGGMMYTWREYETWMRDAGFSKVDRLQLPRDHGVVIGTK